MKFIKNNLGIILIMVGVIGFIYFNNFQETNNHEEILNNEEFVDIEESSEITVEIKGEINIPGIYNVTQDFRVVDLINTAGGLTENADTSSINRAKKLTDEMIVIIPKLNLDESNNSIILKNIAVEIRGEVKYPGVYEMNENSIVNDLIDISGGLTNQADLYQINLAKKLADGQQIVIPKLETKTENLINVEIKGEVNNPGVYVLSEGTIVMDLIDKAGGLTEEANTRNVSLVELLTGNQVIEIPTKDEEVNEIAVDIKGEITNPGVYYFTDIIRLIDVINKAGGLTKDASYQEINLSEVINDEELIIIEKNKNDEEIIAVDIKGEIKYPGVYYLQEGSIIKDLIDLAGGLKPDADREQINLADILTNEQLIIIPEKIDDNDYIYVQIEGEIFQPGIYALLPDSRLIMLINKAGGFTNDADTENLNLTKILQDEEVIYIPSKEDSDNKIYISITGEVQQPGTYYVNSNINVIEAIIIAGGLTLNADAQNINYDQDIQLGTIITIPSLNFVQDPSNSQGLININTANLETLQNLNGIGGILAERIIQYRNSNNGFSTTEEIMNVSGIKESIYEQIKDNITV